jgi:excisionase family DNA binding protein
VELVALYERASEEPDPTLRRVRAWLDAAFALFERSALPDACLEQALRHAADRTDVHDLISSSVRARRTSTLISDLAQAYQSAGSDPLTPPAQRALLLSRGAALLSDDLSDAPAAFDLLSAASVLMGAADPISERLEEFAHCHGFEGKLDTLYRDQIRECLDAESAAAWMRRRATLLDRVGRSSDAADVYAQLLALSPGDAEILDRHAQALRKSDRHKDLLLALERRLERFNDPAREVDWLREIADLWENRLANRWESLDAWKRVLALRPADPEAKEAVKRLTAAERRPSTGELILLFDSDGHVRRRRTTERLELLTTKKAARLAGVKPRTVRKWVKQGYLTEHRDRRTLMIRKDELDALLDRRRAGEFVDGQTRAV